MSNTTVDMQGLDSQEELLRWVLPEVLDQVFSGQRTTLVVFGALNSGVRHFTLGSDPTAGTSARGTRAPCGIVANERTVQIRIGRYGCKGSRRGTRPSDKSRRSAAPVPATAALSTATADWRRCAAESKWGATERRACHRHSPPRQQRREDCRA